MSAPAADLASGAVRAALARGDLRLVPVALVTWATAAALVGVPRAAPLTAVLLGAGAAAFIATAIASRGARGGIVPLAAVACAAACAAASGVALSQPARDAVVDAARSGHAVVAGTVITKVEPSGDDVRFSVDAHSVDGAGRGAVRARVPIGVLAPAGAVEGAALDLGSRVIVSGGVRPTSAGDADAILVFAESVTVEERPPHVLGATSAMRDAFVAVASTLPGPGGELLPGLSVGDTRRVSDGLDAAMKASSLSHLTAVSGANCALVVGLVYGVCAALRAPRGARIACASAALAGFVVLVTPEPSVIRAAAMAGIAMLALLIGRAGVGVAVLSLAVAVIVVADPWLSRSFGFVLSVASTGALLCLAAPLARGLRRWLSAPLAVAVAVPLAAQLACGPVIVLFAPRVPLYGVPANLIAGPAAPMATVAGLVACLLAAVPALGAACAWIAWAPSAWVAHTALLAAGLPRAEQPWWEGFAGFAALAVVGAAISVLLIAEPSRRTATRAARMVSGVVLAVAVGTSAGHALLASRLVGPLTAPREWAVAACDVGQGDAVVLRSAGETMLVDTGPEPETLAACLARLGVRTVDLLVLTHFDADHTGGAAAVAGRVRQVLHGPEDERAAAVMRTLGHPPHRSVVAGDSGALGDASYAVRWPVADAPFPAGNDMSVVIEAGGGRLPRTLLLGDLSERSQAAMLREAPLGAGYAIVKVAHHGSADQSDELYREASPAVALVTVGENDHGHPRAEILGTLRAVGATIARTDRSGLVLVSAAEGGLSVWRERDGQAGRDG